MKGYIMDAKGTVFKYGDNIDTDVIIPARYLNTQDHEELASHCMEDIDKDFRASSSGLQPPGRWRMRRSSAARHRRA